MADPYRAATIKVSRKEHDKDSIRERLSQLGYEEDAAYRFARPTNSVIPIRFKREEDAVAAKLAVG